MTFSPLGGPECPNKKKQEIFTITILGILLLEDRLALRPSQSLPGSERGKAPQLPKNVFGQCAAGRVWSKGGILKCVFHYRRYKLSPKNPDVPDSLGKYKTKAIRRNIILSKSKYGSKTRD